MKKYFGTDGVRGVANTELTPGLAFKLGQAGGFVIAKQSPNSTLVVGRDTRISGNLLESSLVAGLMSVGINVIQLGVLPTPAVAYLTRKISAQGGVMISASHNPFEDNGIKFFDASGYKLTDDIELEIERLIDNPEDIPAYSGASLGTITEYKKAKDNYLDFLKTTITQQFNGLKIVLDCANGAASPIAFDLFSSLGAEVIVIHASPNGTNINVACGSTHPESLQQTVIQNQADIGLAFDGDADRLIAVDHNGNIIDGDGILYVLAKSLKEQTNLHRNLVVTTVMSNFGLQKALENDSIQTVQTSVGDRYVLEEMRKKGYNLGGEQSGHIIFLEHNTTGDGMLAALQLVDAMVRAQRPLANLVKDYKQFPQKLVNVRVQNKKGWESNIHIQEAIKNSTSKLNGNGRILVRASGTENLIRVMAEGENQEVVDALVGEISKTIQQQIS